MNANELADWIEDESVVDIMLTSQEHYRGLVATMLRQQQAELDSLRSVVYWLKENRPEVWDDIKKWSKI